MRLFCVLIVGLVAGFVLACSRKRERVYDVSALCKDSITNGPRTIRAREGDFFFWSGNGHSLATTQGGAK